MNGTIWTLSITALFVGTAAGASHAQNEGTQNPHDSASRYSRMLPLAQYLLADSEVEVAMARSAAPISISDHADVLILGARGYEVAVHGTNGFVCMVDRAWTSDFDDPDYMNPTVREPTCFNAAAARSILPRVFAKTRLAFRGATREEMIDSLRAEYARHELPLPEPGAMSYMMAKHTYFGPYYGAGDPHLMFFFPRTDSLAWGAGLPGSPVIVHQDSPEPITTFVIPLSRWSDGAVVSSGDR